MGLGYAWFGWRGIRIVLSPPKDRAALAAHVNASRCAASAARSNIPASCPPQRELRAGTPKDFAARGPGSADAVRDDSLRTEGVFALRRVAPCNEGLRNAPLDTVGGLTRSPKEKAPASLWKGPPCSRYFFFGLGGGGTKPSTLIAMASLLRFEGNPRTKEASSTPVEGSLVAPKITAFAPTLAARSCIDL
jgi:hypothetical protein